MVLGKSSWLKTRKEAGGIGRAQKNCPLFFEDGGQDQVPEDMGAIIMVGQVVADMSEGQVDMAFGIEDAGFVLSDCGEGSGSLRRCGGERRRHRPSLYAAGLP